MANIKILLLLFLTLSVFSQNEHKIDYEHIFKNWIYIEKTSGYMPTQESVNSISIKNDSGSHYTCGVWRVCRCISQRTVSLEISCEFSLSPGCCLFHV